MVAKVRFLFVINKKIVAESLCHYSILFPHK